MSRINLVDPSTANGKAKELLDGIQKQFGMVPNVFKVMANSPAVLEAFLKLNGTLTQESSISPQLRSQIALAVAQGNECQYCLSANAAMAAGAGLDDATIRSSRKATSSNPRENSALRFAKSVINTKGHVSDSDVQQLKSAGYDDAQIAEILGSVVMAIFTNYFNNVAQTEVDFPQVDLKLTA